MRRILLALALCLAFTAVQAHDSDDDNNSGGDISHVNGGITAEAGQHYGDLDTVNGGISLEKGSVVGKVETVNGGITIQQTEVGGKIDTVAGDITIGADSIVHGGVLVEKPNHSGWNWGFGKPRNPRIVIGPNAVVEGELRFEREVELYVHSTAKIGKVTGATVHTFTDTVPARD